MAPPEYLDGASTPPSGMSGAPSRIFINYRRQDTPWPARELYNVLAGRFGDERVFKDVDTIEPGDDFVERITAAVDACDVLLALIGPRWLEPAEATGQPRLDDPDDFVRLEIATALDHGVRVIPILVDGAVMPSAEQLQPSGLQELARRQAIAIDPNSFDTHRLLATLTRRRPQEPQPPAQTEHLGATPAAPPEATPTPPEATPAPPAATPAPPATTPAPRTAPPAATLPAPAPPAPSRTRRLPGRAVLAAAATVVLVPLLVFVLVQLAQDPGTAAGTTPTPSATTPYSTPSTTPSPSAPPPGAQLAVLAHRGGVERHQLETQQAMEAAARDGYSVETDVRYTADGVAVLVHDEQATKGLDCNGDIQVSQVTWAELNRSCRSKPTAADPKRYRVPKFGAAMEAIGAANPNAWVFPEVKTEQSRKQVREFLEVLNSTGVADRTVVTSFQLDWLRKVHDQDPQMPLMLFTGSRISPVGLHDEGLWALAVRVDVATKTYVSQLHKAGLKVVIWTVNSEEQWQAARDVGADTVVTDFPAKYTAWDKRA